MVSDLLAFVAVIALLAACASLFNWRSCQRRMSRLESRLSESEHLRLELLRQNSELRSQLDSAIKTRGVKPTRAPAPRIAPEAPALAPEPAPAPAPAPAPPARRDAHSSVPPPSWEDTQPYTTAPAPLQTSPAGPLIPRLRG